MADFLAEIPQPDASPNKTGRWTLCVDRASRQTGADIGLQLTSPTRERVEQAVRLGFSATNNKSEYEAMIVGLELALAMGADSLAIQSDSQLVVGQVNTEFKFRDPRMTKYVSLVKRKLNCGTPFLDRPVLADPNRVWEATKITQSLKIISLLK